MNRFPAGVGACLFWALLALRGPSAAASGPVLRDQPNLDVGLRGIVFAVVALSDRSVIVGGAFSEIHDPATNTRHSRANIARILPNGSLDLSWQPEVGGAVRVLARDSANRVYVGGAFNAVGGLPRNNLARINGATGEVDAGWNPFADQPVYALHVDDASNSVFAGGDFVAIGGLLRARLARLSADGWGAGIGSFNTTANETVWVLDGRAGFVYAGGDFTNIGGVPRNYLARITDTGSVDATWNPAPSHEVYALDIAADNTAIYVGGRFNQIGGQARAHVARVALAGAGAVDTQWNPGTNSTVFSIAESPHGWTYLAGAFTHAGGTQTGYGARILSGGLVDGTWVAGFDDFALAATYVDFDRLVYGGQFSGSNGRPASALVQFQTFNTSFGAFLGSESLGGSVRALATLPDGSAIVAGGFTRVVQGSTRLVRKHAFKLDAANRLDPDWHPGADFPIEQVLADASGQVYLGGYFSRVGGQVRNHIARVSGTGSGAVDMSWNPGANNTVASLLLDGSGRLVVGGEFTQLGGLPLARLARIGTSGTGVADPAWAGPVDGRVDRLVRDGSGRLYLSGSFQSIGGQDVFRMAQLDLATGVLNTAWRPDPDGGFPPPIAVAANGGLYASIYRASMPELPLVVRLGPDGSLDPGFAPVLPSATYISAIAPATDGSLHVAGSTWHRIVDLSTGAVDPGWFADADGAIRAMVQRQDGTWLVAGEFGHVLGQPRRWLAAVAPDRMFANGFE